MRFISSLVVSFVVALGLSSAVPAYADEFRGAHMDETKLSPIGTPSGLPADARIHCDAGIEAWRTHDNAGAETHFADAVKGAPENGTLHYNYGLALHLNGNHSAAKAQFEAARKYAGENRAIKSSALLKHHLDGSPM